MPRARTHMPESITVAAQESAAVRADISLNKQEEKEGRGGGNPVTAYRLPASISSSPAASPFSRP